MRARVAERGQITIPKKLRLQLGIKPGTILDFNIKNSTLVIEKASSHDPIAKVYGCLKKKMATDKIIKELRGEE